MYGKLRSGEGHRRKPLGAYILGMHVSSDRTPLYRYTQTDLVNLGINVQQNGGAIPRRIRGSEGKFCSFAHFRADEKC